MVSFPISRPFGPRCSAQVNRDRFWCLSESGESPLYLAAKRGRHGVVKAIVRSGSPRAKEAVELRDHILGATPVFVAALHAHRKACRELAIYGRADLSSKPSMHDEFRKVSAEEVRSRRPAVLRCLHAIDATRVRQTRSWVVSFPILGPFGPRRATSDRDAPRRSSSTGSGPTFFKRRRSNEPPMRNRRARTSLNG